MNKKTQNTPKLPADKGDSKTKTKNAAETTFSAFVKPQGPQTAQTEEDQTHLAYDETEIESLAKQIGIDYENEKKKYFWFLVQVSNLDLPPDWQRVGEPGKIVYYNEKDNITTKRHPSISKFRSLFMEILENEDLGRSKLMELKMKAKQYLENEKKNKELSKNKKQKSTIVLLGSTLSKNLLKGPGAEKNAKLGTSEIQKLVEQGKSQERFEDIKKILQDRRSLFEKVSYEIDNLENSEKVLNSCLSYYEQRFGAGIEEPTTLIKKSEEYEQVDPMEMVEAAKLFNVKSTEPYLFWLLRLYCALPLPDYWNKIFDPTVQMEIFHSLQDNIRISVKPCYTYIQALINNLKEVTKLNPEMRQSYSTKIKLSDKLGRPYEIDFGALLKEVTETDKKDRKYQVYHSMMNQEEKDTEANKNKNKKNDQNSNFKDAHFIEIANQIGIDLKKDIHLMMYIEEFVKERERDEKWFYRQASDGSAFWVNHERKKAIQKYPYLDEVKKFVEEKKQIIELESMRFKKTDHKLLKTIFRKKNEGEAMRLLIDEAKSFVEYYITHKETEFNLSAENQFYNLSNLSKHLGAQLSKNDFMDILFYCPFDFTNLLDGLNILSSEQQLLKKLQVKAKAQDHKTEEVEEENQDEEVDNTKAKSVKEADEFIHQVKSEETRQLLEMASNLNEIAVDPNKKREFLKVMIDFGKKYENDDDEGTPGIAISSGGVKRQQKNNSIDIDSNKRNLKSTTTNLGNSEKDLLSKNLESKGHKKQRKKNAITGGSDEDDITEDDSSPGTKKNLRESKKSGPIKDGDKKTDSGEVTRDSVKKKTERLDSIGSPDRLRDSTKRLSTDFKANNETTVVKDSAMAKYGEKEFQLPTVKDDPNGFGYIYTDDESEDKEDLITHAKDKDEDDDDDEDHDDDHDDEKDEKDEDDEDDEKDEEGEEGEEGEDEEGSEIVDEATGEKKKKKKKKGKKGKKASKDKSLDKKSPFSLSNLKKKAKDTKDGKEYKLLKEMKGTNNATIKDMTKELKSKLNKNSTSNSEIMKPIVAEKSAHDVFAKLVSNQSGPTNRSAYVNREREKERDKSSSLSRGSPQFQLMTDDEEELNFDDLHVIHQEITREDGETEIITVATKKGPIGKIGHKRPKREKKKPNKQLNQTNDDDSIEIMLDENGLPIAIKQKNKKEIKGAVKIPHSGMQPSALDGRKWDYEEIKKTLDKTNMKELDRIVKEKKKLRRDMKKSVNAFERMIKRRDPESKSKFDRRIQFRRSVENLGHSQSPGERRNSAPSALLTTLDEDDDQIALRKDDLMELLKTAYRNERRKKKSSQMKSNASKIPVDPKDQLSFYTPFTTNEKTKNAMRYISYLNSLLFLKKIDDVVVDFLINQFIKSHQAATGLNFNPADKSFREQFKKSYAKAIRTLKEKLKRNKEFIQNTFFQMFFYNVDSIDFDTNMKKALEPIILKSIPISDENLFSPPVKPDVIVPVSPSQIADKGLARTQPDFNKSKVKLPPIKNKKPPPPVNKYNHTTYRNMKSVPKTNEFNDSRMRTLEDNTLEEDEDGDPIIKSARDNNFNAEIDIGKLMKIIPEHIKDNYLFYWNAYGDPMSLDLSYFLSKIAVPEKVQAYLIVLMANRLGLKIAEYSDLTWIPYFHLISKLPSNSDINPNSLSKDKLLLKIAYLPTGDHPGDNYFYSLLNYHKAKRQIILDNISPDQRTQFIKAQSWIKMKNDHGLTYYFNFFSKQKSDDLPSELKESFTKISLIYSKPFVKDNLKSLGYLILRSDDLLAYFKHKH